MNKYIGVIKLEWDSTIGKTTIYLSKTYDDQESFYKWFTLYPNSEHVIMENNEQLEQKYGIYKDETPVTDEEIKADQELDERIKQYFLSRR